MSTRGYEQKARAEAAVQTRLAIIEAVFERLRSAPAERVSVDRIARDAGVARSTVYAIFESRSGLLRAVGLELAARSGYEALLEAKHQPDAREHLRVGMRAGFAMFAKNREIYRALHSMAQLGDDAVAAAVGAEEAERARGMNRLVGRLADQGLLREGLTVAEAESALWVLTSFESFDLLHTARGMGKRAAADLLVNAAERALLADPG